MADFEKKSATSRAASVSDKDEKHLATYEVHEEPDLAEVVVPDDHDEFIDPRLRDYPIPLVAKTVALHNDPTYVRTPCARRRSFYSLTVTIVNRS